MYSRMDKYHGQKVQRFSIRKYSFGAASVAVAAYMMFGGAATVHADVTPSTTPATNEQVNPNAGNQADSSKPVASTDTTTPAAEQPAAPVAETPASAATQPTAPAVEQPASDVEQPVASVTVTKADASKLEAAIARLEAALAKAASTEKTASAIESAKAELASAKAVAANEAATKEEVAKATSAVNGKAFVIESMPKAEKKEEKQNQDSRNGKVIPGQGESGFREASANTTVTNDVITPTNPAQPTAKDIIGSTSTVSRENFTGWDTYTMPFGSHHDGEGDLGVNTPEKIADAEGLEFRVFSDQRDGTRPSPGPSNYTYDGKESDVKARIDYGLKLPAEEVQKIIEEAPLWRGKIRYDGTRISGLVPATYYGNGPYEYLLSSIYKLGYEQGIDKVYVKDASKRIEVTEKAKAAGWTVSDFIVSNMPGGLVYDKQSDSIQGVVTHSSPFNYQQLKASVTFKNTITGKSVTVLLDNHRYGGTAWKDTTPPELKIDDTVKEGKVGEDLVAPVEYKDAGASHAGAPNGRNISYNLTDENGNPLNRTATIRDTVGRAIVGVSGTNITGTTGAGAGNPTELTGNDTKIPGVGFTIASNDMSDNNPNGFKGTPTEAGIYRVSIYARDYNVTNANEAYAQATFKIAPTVSVKNVHAYDKEVPITISKGASEATITLPDGTNTKVVSKNGKWVVSETTNTAVNVNDEIGTVGETFNLKVLPTATAKAATDTINVTASSENVTATFTRAEVTIKTKVGDNVTATFNKTTGRWELPSDIAEKKTVNSDGTTTWLKRDLYVDVNKDGETTFNVYEYTRTLDATGKVTAVNDVSRTLTSYNKENAANSSAESATDTNKGMVVTVKYDKGLNKWTADDNSTVTATKTGDKWTISTTSGFNGTIDAVETASSSDKASVLNDAPDVTSTSYTIVKGATVDLVKQASAAVTITDREDDATIDPTKKETTVTKVTLTSPSGKVTEYHSAAEVAAVKLTETGNYTVKVDVKDSNGNVVTADSDTATGTNEGDNTAIASTTYVITVKNQATSKLYTVEDETVTSDQLKDKVNPTAVDGFTPTKNDITNIPATSGQAGKTLPTPATVTYTKGTETISVETTVDVVVLPKVTPTGVTVLKDSTDLETVVKEKAKEAAKAIATDKIPTGIKVSIKQVKEGTLPATTTTGVQTPAKVVVEYKDANDNVVETREVEVPVTVVGSTVNKIVKLEGEELTDDEVKAAVTAGTDGKKGEPLLSENITSEPGTKEVPIPVTYNNDSLSERVLVPVVVLPKATGDVDVPKGSTVEKVKEAAKAKATELVTSADFKDKLPEGSKDVVVGDVTEEVLATMTAEKGTDKGIVKVPVTYTVDGKTYTKDAEITVNVLGSVPKTVYTVEGTKPDANKVKEAVTPDAGGTVGTPTEADLPETTGKVGAKDVTVPTTVTYPSGTEIVKVPVTVLPKATPEKVTTLKDTTGENLTTAVKEKAQAALGKLTLPSGVTAELVPNQTYAVPTTDSNGDKTAVPVKVQYKDATGTVVAEDTINVPVTVVSSTPSKIVVFEGEEVTADAVKGAVTPGTDGTKGTPVIPTDLTKQSGEKEVTVPVTYEGIKDPEQVKVPVTVLPVAKGDVTVAKGTTPEELKKLAKAQADEAIKAKDFTDKLPKDAEVTVGDVTEEVLAKLTEKKGTNTGTVNVPVTYKIPGDDTPHTTTIPVTVNVVEVVPTSIETPVTNTLLTPEDYTKGITIPEGGKVTNVENIPDLTTPGKKDPVKVTVELPNGQTVTVEVPVTVTPVKEIETPVTKTPLTQEDYTKGITIPEGGKVTNVENIPDLTTPGKKDPVKVTVELPNGKVVTVEVPVTVTPVKEIETPVTKTPLTPEDYTKGITIPEGGKVTNVENIPDLTTPGKKDPVKVTVELPNGKVVTVDVPVNVTPVKEIETPVTKTPLTPEDYTKGITIPEGGKVTNVENIPDLTTPGKKDPVKVTVELPNGKVVTVDVPVNVTPVKEIETPVTKTPLTPEDYTKGITIPEGGKVTNVENIPDLTTPGKKDPVKVTVELPNGQTITVDVPVNVTPVKEIETPVTKTPLTPEDYTKGIKIPEGGKVTNVENIPDLTTPGKKDPVKVTVELPNGKVITVEVPVNVTPVKEIETPVTNTPLTKDDISKYVKVPEGGRVTNVENIPDLTTPGKKDPVKVTVELPNGKVITVEVPVNVTPVKEIETPVTNTPLTKDDISKYVKVPEGGRVTNVENIPDLTTPGKKDPVKVTVELPNGKVITVEVPVNVTPITPIETPVTKNKLTPEDILKQIKVPEGATTKVENIPDLTTPGKKDPVKVTVELPNGKVVTVEIPVNVTPVSDIVKKQGDPITTEDVEKHIPKGVKVISIGDKPSTDVPGERPSIPVVVELPNGIQVTMNIPVIVTPKVTPVVVSVGTPVTPEDVQKHFELPKGWKVTKVGEIPTTETPGTKPVVPVEIELPDGRKITVDVPVIVTPTVRQIVVPQGTPISPDDVKGHIDLPKEPGWEIVEVGEIPTTIPAGVKPSVKVKIKVPTGEIVEVDVPVIVTPKVTPIVVEVGTPITEEDVKKKVDLPEGWEIVEVGEIPTTETSGVKKAVKVKVKLPNGDVIELEVPVTVTPKSQNGGGVISQNGDSTVQIVTEYLDENGNRITSDKEGKHNPIELEGYEFSHSTTDAKGNTLHHYKKVGTAPSEVETPRHQEQPTTPNQPAVPTPVETSVPTDSATQPATPKYVDGQKELPNTGTEAHAGLAALGLLGALSGFGLLARKKKED